MFCYGQEIRSFQATNQSNYETKPHPKWEWRQAKSATAEAVFKKGIPVLVEHDGPLH